MTKDKSVGYANCFDCFKDVPYSQMHDAIQCKNCYRAQQEREKNLGKSKWYARQI